MLLDAGPFEVFHVFHQPRRGLEAYTGCTLAMERVMDPMRSKRMKSTMLWVRKGLMLLGLFEREQAGELIYWTHDFACKVMPDMTDLLDDETFTLAGTDQITAELGFELLVNDWIRERLDV